MIDGRKLTPYCANMSPLTLKPDAMNIFNRVGTLKIKWRMSSRIKMIARGRNVPDLTVINIVENFLREFERGGLVAFAGSPLTKCFLITSSNANGRSAI